MLRTVAIPALVVLVVLTPWTIRNALQMDAFVPISTNFGDTLCMGRTEDANGQFRFADVEGPTLTGASQVRVDAFDSGHVLIGVTPWMPIATG